MSAAERAKLAVENGADLVVEIPTIFAMNNAGYFAKAGVEILEALGVEYISFGTEEGELERLVSISEYLKSHETEIEDEIKELKKDGLSYPRAREIVLKKALKDQIDNYSDILSKPNNNLALEYLKYMRRAKPVTIKRIGDYNGNDNVGFSSASKIREKLFNKEDITNDVPGETFELLKNKELPHMDLLLKWIMQEVLTSSTEELNSIYGAEEGLGSILKKNIRNYTCYEDIVNDLKSKAYTRTRVQRTLTDILLHIRKDDILHAKNYIRVLAFSENGAKYLKEIKKKETCPLPIITNINKEGDKYSEIQNTLNFDILASDIYNAVTNKDVYLNSDFVKYPLKL